MSEWMTIESAPRDGTPVIALRNNGMYVADTMYWACYEDGSGAWHWLDDGDTPECQPTHWKPFIVPPKD